MNQRMPGKAASIVLMLVLLTLIGVSAVLAASPSREAEGVSNRGVPGRLNDIAPLASAITLSKTVGTAVGTCATTQDIVVDEGTVVYYCYTVTNTGQTTVTNHTLVDSQFGTLLSNFPLELPPAAVTDTVSLGIEVSATITLPVSNFATWSVTDLSGAEQASASDSATVMVAPTIELTKTVGVTPGVCASTDSIIVTPGTNVYYCYTVTNTSPYTLPVHDLSDDVLGPIFEGLAYDLGPGQSVDTVAAGLEISATIDATTVNTATWTAYTDGGLEATAQSTATVEIANITVDKKLVAPYTGDGIVVVGQPAVFQIDITNTGVTTFTQVPVQDVYSDTCMIFAEASPPPDATGPAELMWTDLVSGTTGLGAGEAISVTVTFTPTSACTASFNTAVISDAVDSLSNTLTVSDTTTFQVRQPSASLGGHVFWDKNADGIFQPWLGETGIGGVQITRIGMWHTVTTQSNFIDGWYGFYIDPGELPGYVTVKQTQPYGYNSTTPNEYKIMVLNGDNIKTLNFGEIPWTPTPTPTNTPTPTPTPTDTPTPTPTPTDTPTPTPTSTPTATPVPLYLPVILRNN